MKTVDILKNRRIEQFNQALPTGAGILAPRPGYYLIKDVYYKTFGIHAEVPIARTLWTPSLNSPFIESLMFEIALTSIQSHNPYEASKLTDHEYIGRLLSINEARVMHELANEERRAVLNLKWCFIKLDPQFVDETMAGLIAFQGNFKTLFEATTNFRATAPYDVFEAEEWEALYGGPAIEDVDVDSSFDYDGFDYGDDGGTDIYDESDYHGHENHKDNDHFERREQY